MEVDDRKESLPVPIRPSTRQGLGPSSHKFYHSAKFILIFSEKVL